MEYQQQYRALLAKNNAANNLLVLNLLQSQENWSKENALVWIFRELIPKFQTLQQERLFYFGSIGLSFIFHHALLEEEALRSNISNQDYLHKAVLICCIQYPKQSKVLYKIDYIEEASNLLEKYKQHLLEYLEQIVRNFVIEMK